MLLRLILGLMGVMLLDMWDIQSDVRSLYSLRLESNRVTLLGARVVDPSGWCTTHVKSRPRWLRRAEELEIRHYAGVLHFQYFVLRTEIYRE